MANQADRPLRKVTLHLYDEDYEFLLLRYDNAAEAIRGILHKEVTRLMDSDAELDAER